MAGTPQSQKPQVQTRGGPAGLPGTGESVYLVLNSGIVSSRKSREEEEWRTEIYNMAALNQGIQNTELTLSEGMGTVFREVYLLGNGEDEGLSPTGHAKKQEKHQTC